MRTISISILLMACGGAPSHPTTAPPAVSLDRPYACAPGASARSPRTVADPAAALFDDGRALRYRLVRDEPARGIHDERTVDCILAARALGTHRVAGASCGDIDVASGRLVANQRGLWFVSGMPADEAAAAAMIDGVPALLPFPLAAVATRHRDGKWSRVVERDGAWCKEWGEGVTSPDEVRQSRGVCVAPGLGITCITTVRVEPDGLESHEFFELVP